MARQSRQQKERIRVIAKYLNTGADVIEARLMGDYNLGCSLGTEIYTDDYILFHRNGETNMPRKSHAIWFMAQYQRFDYLKQPPDYMAIADKLIMQDLYKEVALSMKIKIPDDDMKPFTIDLDKAKFDPNRPADYLKMVNMVIP